VFLFASDTTLKILEISCKLNERRFSCLTWSMYIYTTLLLNSLGGLILSIDNCLRFNASGNSLQTSTTAVHIVRCIIRLIKG
jgi:hypothetical protein